MKQFLTIFSVCFFTFAISACGQGDKSKRPSPPEKAEFKAGTATVTIEYSAPSVKGREVWGKLVPYGEVWRTGANEATTFETDADVKIEGQLLPKGKYALFTIPGKEEWIIVFNKKSNQWGSMGYKKDDDALRVSVRPGIASSFNEKFKIEPHIDGSVSILWEKLEIIFNVTQ
jgi:hypothetical protein